MRFLSILLVVLLLMPAVMTEVRAGDENDEDMVGDWIITGDEVVVGRNITLQGDLKILSGGLTLIDSNIRMKCYADGQFDVHLNERCYLRMFNSSFSREPGYRAYYIQIDSKSRLFMENSSIQGAGYGEKELSGLYLNKASFTVRNSTFRGDYAAIWAENYSGGKIINSSFEYNRRGIFLHACNDTLIDSSYFYQHANESIRIEEGHGNTVSGCHIERSYGRDGRGIHVVNESNFTATGNLINSTSYSGILIEGGNSSMNIIRDNTFMKCGNAQISMVDTDGQEIYGNVLGHCYQSILVKDSRNISIKWEDIPDVSTAIRVENSELHLRTLFFRNVSRYGIISYASNIIIQGISMENVSMFGYFSEGSTVFSNSHLQSPDYTIKDTSLLYLYHIVDVHVQDQHGKPLGNVSLELSFEGRPLFHAMTDINGNASMIAPYMLHSAAYGKNYSWCEVKATIARHHFRENPIRFYSWERDNITFEEVPRDLQVIVTPDPPELRPGDILNISILVLRDGEPVNGATLTVSIDGQKIGNISFMGNGTYFVSTRAPEFKDYLMVFAEADDNGSAGIGQSRVMMKALPPPEPEPAPVEKSTPYYYYAAPILLAVLILILLIRRRKKAEPFERMAPVVPDMLEIEKR